MFKRPTQDQVHAFDLKKKASHSRGLIRLKCILLECIKIKFLTKSVKVCFKNNIVLIKKLKKEISM